MGRLLGNPGGGWVRTILWRKQQNPPGISPIRYLLVLFSLPSPFIVFSSLVFVSFFFFFCFYDEIELACEERAFGVHARHAATPFGLSCLA
jgi:hypothetical protein